MKVRRKCVGCGVAQGEDEGNGGGGEEKRKKEKGKKEGKIVHLSRAGTNGEAVT